MASEALLARYWAVTNKPIAVPRPNPEKRSDMRRNPGIYIPTRPTPAAARSAIAPTMSSATNGNAMWAASDNTADQIKMCLGPNRSVKGTTSSADTTYPARYAE